MKKCPKGPPLPPFAFASSTYMADALIAIIFSAMNIHHRINKTVVTMGLQLPLYHIIAVTFMTEPSPIYFQVICTNASSQTIILNQALFT